MKLHFTNHGPTGNLALAARPRGNDWLRDEIEGLNFTGIHTLVSLLEWPEAQALQLEKEASYCHELGIEFISFPIKDRNLPEDPYAFLALTDKIVGLLDAGEKVVIHCRMGIGRTGMLAAAVLLKQGFEPAKVFDFLSGVRNLNVPDTEAQKEWVLNLFTR